MNLHNSFIGDQAQGLRSTKRHQPIQVLAVTAGKGGVGKTNVSINLAIALAKMNKRVMLLDADLGLANVDVMLGLHPRFNLEHVIKGECSLSDIIVYSPEGVAIIPSSSGITSMANLSTLQMAGIVDAFNELANDVDILIVDTAAGIDNSVMNFTRAAQEVIVVVCDEPTSITDSYALIKILSRDYGISRFNILANMVNNTIDGRALYNKINRVSERFLDVTLNYLGSIPFDEYLRKSVKQQKAFITAYPSSSAADNMRKVAQRVTALPRYTGNTGRTAFFIEDMLVDA